MDDIITFLNARLDEDEAIARGAAPGPYPRDADPPLGVWLVQYGTEITGSGMTIYDEGGHDDAQATHIARHDPARVLREVAAKRAILAEHKMHRTTDYHNSTIWYCAGCNWINEEDDTLRCDTTLHLASVYSDHPDYRQEWA